MNATAILSSSDTGSPALSASTQPTGAIVGIGDARAFFSLVNLFLQPEPVPGSVAIAESVNTEDSGNSAPTAAPLPRLTPAQIADALLRSMLGMSRRRGALDKAELGGAAHPAQAFTIPAPSATPITITMPITTQSTTPAAQPPSGTLTGGETPAGATQGVTQNAALTDAGLAKSRGLQPGTAVSGVAVTFGARLLAKAAPLAEPTATTALLPQNGDGLKAVQKTAALVGSPGDQKDSDPLYLDAIPRSTGMAPETTGRADLFVAPVAASAPLRSPATNPGIPETAAPAVLPEPALTPRIHEMVMRIAAPSAPAVDIQVTQRGGEVQVTVRSPDQDLRSALRQDLPELVSALDRAGFHAETFAPRPALSAGMGSAFEQNSGEPGADTSRQQSPQNFQQYAQQNSQQQQRQREQQEQRWQEEMEN